MSEFLGNLKMDAQIKHWRSLLPNDIETLHLILYSGSWPMTEALLDPEWAKYDSGKHLQFEIARLNRLKKTGWVVIADRHLWLTPTGLDKAPLWLNGAWAQTAKRYIKGHFKRPLLKHRIPWNQIACLWLRDEAIKTPLARWFDPALQTRV